MQKKTFLIKREEQTTIYIGNHLLATLPELFPSYTHYFILTDETAYSLFSREITAALKKAKKMFTIDVLPAGEKSKDMVQIIDILKVMCAKKLDRSAVIIALGGEV